MILTDTRVFDSFFLHQGEEGAETFQKETKQVVDTFAGLMKGIDQPFTGLSAEEVKQQVEAVMEIPDTPQPLADVLHQIKDPVLKNSLHVSHEKSMAHLHCPPLLTGVVSELLIGALNQSMDSWDQSPAATYVEEELIRYCVDLIRYPEEADGVFTSGGTQSNYTGLLLARDSFCLSRFDHHVQRDGLPGDFDRMRVLCSEDAHFSVKKSLSQLGLGERAVVPVPVDEQHRMDQDELEQMIDRMEADGLYPFAVVGTCGTTDFGSIDPMESLADLCEQKGLWLHIDAAYGGGLLWSHRHHTKLAGIERADSVTFDFHKWLFQPVSCGVFMVKDRKHFNLLSYHADYLNPAEDEEEGILNLVNKSIQTTRRFDALKILLTLKTIGTEVLGDMIDRTVEVAAFAASELSKRPGFHVENREPELSAVVFQYWPNGQVFSGERNRFIQQRLFEQGSAVIAKTSVNGETNLKFTILNPRTTEEDVIDVIDEMEEVARRQNEGGEL